MPIVLADRVVAEPVSWLWPNVIPEGKLVILDGDPDVGKSLIAERAKKGLGLRSRQAPRDGRTVTYCCLRHQTVLTGNPDRDDFQRTLDELEKQHPRITPLDDRYYDDRDSDDNDTDTD